MKKWTVMGAAAALLAAGTAVAHPTSLRFETRGECEVAFAEASKFDRPIIVQLGFEETIGGAQTRVLARFECEYDEDEEAWRIVDYGMQP